MLGFKVFFSGRIVVVASSMHKFVKEFDFDNVMSEKSYSLFNTYAQSKLANMLFGFEMQRRLFAKGSKVTCNVVHPGIVTTEVTRNMSSIMRNLENAFHFLLQWVRKSPAEGAYTTVHVATAPELEGKGGLYFQVCMFLRLQLSHIAAEKQFISNVELTTSQTQCWCP